MELKTGIFGGSFNPVHNGHIYLANTCIEQFGLDRVYLVPSKISPHRSDDEYVPEQDRLEMLKIACRGNSKLVVSSYELNALRVSYSIYTVEHFRRKFPDDTLYLLTGGDMLMSFEKWYRFEDILKNAVVCAVPRNEGERKNLVTKAERLGEYGQILVADVPPLVVSSTEIRKKIEKNENFSCYLDENVVQYIKSRELYRIKS